MQAAATHPAFFAQVPAIRVRDPLAHFLGAATGGVLEYGYADAVKLAGHSCPTVASAYLMARAALAALYGEALPERGGVRVELRDEATEGVTGVVGNVMALLTGAAGEGGFKGIGGYFDRRGLITYGVPMAGDARFTRLDTGASVEVAARLDRVPGDPRASRLLARCIGGQASEQEEREFHELWQGRVQRVLQHADDPDVIVVEPAAA
jgi:hypothetical protein